MPITITDGVVSESEATQLKRTLKTDVHPSSDFAICDAKQPLKQLQFSLSGMTDNTTATLSVPASGTYALPATAGTLGGQNKVLQYAAPETAANVTIAAGTEVLVLKPAGTLDELTITLPVTPLDGTTVTFVSSQIVTSLTVADGAASQVGGPTALSANVVVRMIYRLADTTWYRI
jgi:hypothetical protein